MELTLKGHQPQAFDACVEWFKTPRHQRKPVYRLYGSAGVGKTTVAMKFSEFTKVAFMTLSGKAALVMRKKGCEGASTIHSQIYELVDGDMGGEPEFVLRRDALHGVGLIVLDEAAMVDDYTGEDLLSFGIPILALGDPNQLPPPNDRPGFLDLEPPDFVMTEVLRQAKDSPIIAMAYQVLETGRIKPGKYGSCEVFSKIRADRERDLMMAADQVLCGKNATRVSNNLLMREWLSLQGNEASHLPVVGDRLICLRNDRKKGLINGEQFLVEELVPNDLGRVVTMNARSLDFDNVSELNVPWNYFNGTEFQMPDYERKNFDQATFAYLMTVHKSQGSQWDKVLILDESGVFKQHKRNHLYTAITRAAEEVNIIL